MDKYYVDSQKMVFHPRKVADWLEGEKEIYPINAEICISGACNHRCVFCAADYMGYKPDILSRELMKDRIMEMHEKGLKSVLYAGTGEPLTNNEAADIIIDTKKIGVDVALSTNGVLFTPNIIERCLPSISWVRFSVSGGTEDTYNKIHRGKPGDLQKVFDNIHAAAEFKRRYNLKTVINVQIVMVKENEDEIVQLAKKVKELGADQYLVKSVGVTELQENNVAETMDRNVFYGSREEMQRELELLNDESFSAIFRVNRINRMKTERAYKECYGAPFHVNIDANGNVWPCCCLIGMKNMCYGNIKENTFEDVWKSEERMDVLKRLKDAELAMCPVGECKLGAINEYLHKLKNPNEHVNFI